MTKTEPVLALFELEPIGLDDALEANGRVFHFCSDHCREEFKCGFTDDTYAYGTSTDAITGTVCDECGGELPA